MIKITFDPRKDETNRRDRGISLSLGEEVIRNGTVRFVDERKDYGETRFVTYGQVNGRLHVCVYTIRSDTVRVISVRKANDREVSRYGG
jgi:uncharacterized protein